MKHYRQNVEAELAAMLIVTAIILMFSVGTVGVFIWIVNNLVKGIIQ